MKEKYTGSAWKIMAAMMCIQAGTLGVLMNCNGILFSAVLRDLGFRAGDLSIYYTIRSLAQAFFVTITTKLVFEHKSNVTMALLACFLVVPYAAMFFFNHLWQFYAAGLSAGLGMSCTMTVIPMVLNNWFKSRNGFVIGLTMSASGIAGALFSPICSKLIVALGWRTTAVIMGIIGFVLIVLPAYFFLIKDPKEIGEQPYGVSEADERKSVSESTDTAMKRVLPASVFLMTLVAVVGPGSLIQMTQQLPTFAQTIGYTIETGALLTSLAMIGNLSGKLLLGTLADKFGVYRAAFLFTCVTACSMFLFFAFSSVRPLLYLASVMFGMTYAIGMTVPSLLYLDLYGKGEYRDRLSRMQAINGLVGAASGAVIPYVYDLSGSFKPVFLCGIVLCAAAGMTVLRLQKYGKDSAGR